MANAITSLARLTRSGLVVMKHGARVLPEDAPLPAPARWLLALLRRVWRKPAGEVSNEQRLSAALTALGPSYIKLGQFLATRDDLVGRELAEELSRLQDRLPPFSMSEAKAAVRQELGAPVEELFTDFGQPVAAASIAQVHKARVRDDGQERDVAVKILRPGVEQRFRRDLESFAFAARMIEKLHPPSRRLRPRAVVETLAQSVTIEMDLRMEAAAISEMAENTADDPGFRVPKVDWARSAQRVLTLEWIDGVKLSDRAALEASGHDLKALGAQIIHAFLRHAMRDGFFHADMHPGNLFVDAEGNLVAVDFGIMGRLGPIEQRFLAEILYGFINRDYRRVADVHFEAGYVPRRQSREMFAQALRAIGEPLMDRTADEISMGHLLGQLFQYTEVFNMQTQPQLILLQKTMVVVEGVARQLDPQLNMWTTAEPVVREWMEAQLGMEHRLQEAAEGAQNVGQFVGEIPRLLGRAERMATAFSEMAEEGLRLDAQTIERLAEAQARRGRLGRAALWIGALSLAAIAAAMSF
ncbi:MAG: 2-polyprenylphenol 6-hydroxylase [Methyloligellaceae bacterium]